ncbi:hypothetical protein LCGC14_0470390 [marine sediment metagenome]|uniref:Uncharacterized protein n=1 Tax=marine sediment metagenome TaxID=412755 RepID=A0A0F9SCH5_9ZZZZ
MTEIIIPGQKDPHDVDKEKDCSDFVPLNDGTIHGDKKYCDRSFACKQIGMLGQWVEIDKNGKIVARDYLCTGKHPIWEERSEDENAT